MRVVYLAAGAGGMICGSCLRDNRLAATLIERGHDVVVAPLYTPLRVDETYTADGPIYFGGINVVLQQTARLFRHTPRWMDAILDNRRLLRAVGRLSSGADPTSLGAMTVSLLRGRDGRQRKELDRLAGWLERHRPDVINLANLMFAGLAADLKHRSGAKIVCTLSGEDIFLDRLTQPHRDAAFDLIRRSTDHVDAFVATSRYYARHCAGHFALPANKIHHVPMGIRVTDFAPVRERSASSEPTIGYFARISHDKGFVQLCDAFVRLNQTGHPCRLRAGGYLGKPDIPAFEQGKRLIADAGLLDRFAYVGEVDRRRKIAFFHAIDIFSVPAAYREAKGLSVIEAMAAGVPVVQPRHGSYPELVDATGGGVLVAPGSTDELVEAIACLMSDPVRRRRLSRAAQTGTAKLFSDQVMADATWRIYRDLCAAT